MAHTRRMPVQERAKRRRASMLDATARLLERVGYSAVTTNAVAKEASTSIGAVYEYFPNKEALLLALLDRYQEQLQVALAEALANTSDELLIEALFDGFVEFYAHEPGYRQLWLGSQLTDLLLAVGRGWSDDFVAWLDAPLAVLAPALSPERRSLVLTVSLQQVSSLVTSALLEEEPLRSKMIEEARTALLRYLTPELG